MSRAVIPLSQGLFALVDEVDFGRVSQVKWHASRANSKSEKWYAMGYVREGARRRHVLLHRFILGPSAGPEIDHANGNSLDCRRSNLRPATRSQNMANKPAASASGLKGVWLHKGRWVARIRVDGRNLYLGRFDSAREAAEAYDRNARSFHGEFARLNFPDAA